MFVENMVLQPGSILASHVDENSHVVVDRDAVPDKIEEARLRNTGEQPQQHGGMQGRSPHPWAVSAMGPDFFWGLAYAAASGLQVVISASAIRNEFSACTQRHQLGKLSTAAPQSPSF